MTGGAAGSGACSCASIRGSSQTSTHSLEGRKREERVGELRNVARHKRALTGWRGGRGRSGLRCVERWDGTKGSSRGGGEDEKRAGWGGSRGGTSRRRALGGGGG